MGVMMDHHDELAYEPQGGTIECNKFHPEQMLDDK